MNPDKFYQRTKLFNDILYEIFNVESNYRTELNVLNLKLLAKIEEHKNKINKKRQDKMLKLLTNRKKTFKIPEKKSNVNPTLVTSRSKDNIFYKKEDDPMIDQIISEGLQSLLTFYKAKHKLISKEVSNLGIILYNFSSSQKRYDNIEENLEKFQKKFELYFVKYTTIKKNYFEKMNELELFFHEEENKKKSKEPKKKNEKDNQNKENEFSNEKEKQKIDEIIKLREKYKRYLAKIKHYQKAYISKINEIGNDIQEFNITENDILYDIFKNFEQKLAFLIKEVNKFCLLYDHNKKLIQDLNIELGNNMIYDNRLYINYKFEEYTPKFTDIENQNDLSVIQKMNKLIGFELDKIKTNNSTNNKNLIDNILYNKDIDDNLLFILLMDKFIGEESILNGKEKTLLINLLNQEIYIKQFLQRINNIRINKFIFNKKEKFELLLEFFNIIFSKLPLGEQKYHELVKILMILSETFFYKDGENKIYLDNVVAIPKELKETKFWIRFIELEIEIEYKKYENKKNIRYEFIVFLSNTTHLREYLNEKEKKIEIIEYFKNKYKFTIEELDIIKEQLKI